MTAGSPLPENSNHIRMMDLTKDLDVIADLIEMCFPISSDPDGQSYVREMRKAARDMRIMGWLNRVAEFGTTRSAGFVWEEDGEVIGNLSLIPFTEGGRRVHLIANVAVRPDHRRRGIGRALTVHALGHLRRKGDQKTWLQVREDNPPAVELYRSVGFSPQAVRTTWRIKPGEVNRSTVSRMPEIRLRRRAASDWDAQQAWLAETYPQLLRWNLPVQFTRFTPGALQAISNFVDGYHFKHWALANRDRCLGMITWQKTTSFADNLWVAFSESLEAPYLGHALLGVLRGLPRLHPVSIDYAKGRSEKVFTGLGFENFRTLIWMSCQF